MWQGCKEIGNFIIADGKEDSVALEKTGWRYLKNFKVEWPSDAVIPLLSMFPKELKGRTPVFGVFGHPCFSSIIHNRQKGKINPLCPNRCIHKQNAAYTHNGMLSSLKKEGDSITCLNTVNPEDLCAKWYKPDAKTSIRGPCTYKVPTVVEFLETESRMMVARSWGKQNGEFVLNGDRVSIWENEKVLEDEWWVVAKQCEFT